MTDDWGSSMNWGPGRFHRLPCRKQVPACICVITFLKSSFQKMSTVILISVMSYQNTLQLLQKSKDFFEKVKK